MKTVVFRLMLFMTLTALGAGSASAASLRVVSTYEPAFEASGLSVFGSVDFLSPTGAGDTLYWYTEVRDGLLGALRDRVLQSVDVGMDAGGGTTYGAETETYLDDGPGDASGIQVAGGSMFMGESTNDGAIQNLYEYGLDGSFDGLVFGGPLNDASPGQAQSLNDPELLAHNPDSGEWFMHLGEGDGSVMSVYRWNAGESQWDIEIDVEPFQGLSAASGLAYANGALWLVNTRGTQILEYRETGPGLYGLTTYDVDDMGLALTGMRGLGYGPNGNLWTVGLFGSAAPRIVELEAPFESGTVIPEPSSLALLGIGVAGCLVREARRRRLA